jgi:hypothetical protein
VPVQPQRCHRVEPSELANELIRNLRNQCPCCSNAIRNAQSAAVRWNRGSSQTHPTVQFLIGSWVAGVPKKGWIGGVKLKGRRMSDITTYRCTSCGYLESYATP